MCILSSKGGTDPSSEKIVFVKALLGLFFHVAMKVILGLLLFLAVAFSSEITKWNTHLLNQIAFSKLNPPAASRQIAMLTTAQFEAANTVQDIYERYLPAPLTTGTSAKPKPAAAQAARDILVFFYPANQSFFDAELATSLAAFSGYTLSQSVSVGQAAAAAIIANRTGDGSSTASTGYTAPDPLEDGVWRPTGPAFASYLLPNWRLVKTFGYPTPAALAAEYEAPARDSISYLADLDQVHTIGGTTSTTRTSEQSLIARVWAAGGGTVTPPGQWIQIAIQVSESFGLSFMEEAQTFARLGVSLADAAIICWATKYNEQLWRPVTAIQAGGDSTWTSYIVTPPFPSYTSGHSTFSGAAAKVLREQTGKNKHDAFTVTAGGESRTLTKIQDAADEAAMSRVYGGIHYLFDSEDGLEIGKAIGKYNTKNIMRLKADCEDE